MLGKVAMTMKDDTSAFTRGMVLAVGLASAFLPITSSSAALTLPCSLMAWLLLRFTSMILDLEFSMTTSITTLSESVASICCCTRGSMRGRGRCPLLAGGGVSCAREVGRFLPWGLGDSVKLASLACLGGMVSEAVVLIAFAEQGYLYVDWRGALLNFPVSSSEVSLFVCVVIVLLGVSFLLHLEIGGSSEVPLFFGIVTGLCVTSLSGVTGVLLPGLHRGFVGGSSVLDLCCSGSKWLCVAVCSVVRRVFGIGVVFLFVGVVHSGRFVVVSSAWARVSVRVGVRCGFRAGVSGVVQVMRAYIFASLLEDSRKSVCISFIIVAGSSLAQAPSDKWYFCSGLTLVAFRHLRRAWWRRR